MIYIRVLFFITSKIYISCINHFLNNKKNKSRLKKVIIQ